MITAFITNRVIKLALAALPSLPAMDEGWVPIWLQIEPVSSLRGYTESGSRYGLPWCPKAWPTLVGSKKTLERKII